MEAQWNRTHVQLEIMRRIWPILDESHQAVQLRTFGVLMTKLMSARDKLKSVVRERANPDGDGDKKSAIKRLKYAFVKSSLDEAIKSLDKWQRMYDPSWYLFTRVLNPLIDTELDEVAATRPSEHTTVLAAAGKGRAALHGEASSAVHFTLPSGGLDKFNVSSIPYSGARHAERPGTTGLVIESINCLPGAYVCDMDQDVRLFAAKLNCVDSAIFGVLKCKGLAKVKTSKA